MGKLIKKNNIVYIVGGLGLIGKNLVNAFFKKKIKVVVFDIKKKYFSRKFKYITLDKLDLYSLEKSLKFAFDKYGTPNILVNASYPKTNDWNTNSYRNIKTQSFSKNIELHLNSFVWISKIVADEMKKKKIKNGSIINLASIYGLLGQDPKLYKNIKNMSESITYPVIKGGIINSCKSMAAYYGQYNIRVNCISPGGIFDNQKNEFVKRYIDKTPLSRMGSVQDLTGPVLFLASEEASYITGINLIVDGGFSII